MLEVKSLTKNYRIPNEKCKLNFVRAVADVNFTLQEGECCALVGESGSGKSTLSQMLMGLIPPSVGDVLLDGQSVFSLRGRETKTRFLKLQMVLQDGKSALDPRFTVYDSIAEPIRNLLRVPREQERKTVELLMHQMELPLSLLGRHARELSGGQQKRVCIARAISVSPQFLILDEAVSGLDVIVRKTILDLLKQLQREQGFAYLFITHDIDVALYLADRVMVMKDGKIVENVRYSGDPGCFSHPYSRLLLESLIPENTAIQT